MEVLQETADVIRRRMLEDWDLEKVYDPAVKEHLEEQFSYQYPYPKGGEQKLKFTVSELKKRVYFRENRRF